MVNGSFTDASASEGSACLRTPLVRRRDIGYSGRRLIDRRRPDLSESVEDRADPPEGWPGKPAAARIPWLHDLYDWTMAQAAAPYALWMLALISFVESSVFPIPPDVLLIPMVLAMRDRAWLIAGVCTLASVAGGFLGYAIGALLFETLGRPILELYGFVDQFAEFRTSYNEWGAWIVFFAGLTPFPYKVITIASGVTGLDLWTFGIASVFGRGMRFFAVAALLWWFGPPIKRFIEANLGWLTLAFFVLLFGGFLLLKLL
jgi:membrane protein YqaA with SNARE-associated domain